MYLLVDKQLAEGFTQGFFKTPFIDDNSRFEKDSKKRLCQSLEDVVGLK